MESLNANAKPASPLTRRRLRLPLPWLIGLLALHVLPFAVRPALIGGDEPHYALIAHSMVSDLDVDLANNYQEVEAGSAAAGSKAAGRSMVRHVRTVGGRQLPIHPIGLPLLVAPVLAMQQALAPGSAPDLLFGLLTLSLTFCALLAGWRLLSTYLGDSQTAAFVAFGSYFSSPLWYYSRSFFTEPYTWSLAVLSIAALSTGRVYLAGILLALVLAMKETGLLLVVPILLVFTAIAGWKAAVKVAIGPCVFMVLFVCKNLVMVGDPVVFFQAFAVGDPIKGGWGLLFDPSHGLVFFAPLLVVGAWGLVHRNPVRQHRWIVAGALVAVASYYALTALWSDWRGGSSYGPRLLVPILPALAIGLAQLMVRRNQARWRWAFSIIFLPGFLVNWCAALQPFPAAWGMNFIALLGCDPLNTVCGVIFGPVFLWLLITKFRKQDTRIEEFVGCGH